MQSLIGRRVWETMNFLTQIFKNINYIQIINIFQLLIILIHTYYLSIKNSNSDFFFERIQNFKILFSAFSNFDKIFKLHFPHQFWVGSAAANKHCCLLHTTLLNQKIFFFGFPYPIQHNVNVS